MKTKWTDKELEKFLDESIAYTFFLNEGRTQLRALYDRRITMNEFTVCISDMLKSRK
jgi:hypothetical protein